jgi:hypothetical protein
MSVCSSARRQGLNPWTYLRDVLDCLATGTADVNELLPDAWATRHRPAG